MLYANCIVNIVHTIHIIHIICIVSTKCQLSSQSQEMDMQIIPSALDLNTFDHS